MALVEVLEPLADELAAAVRTPEVVVDASLPEDVTGGEYANYSGTRAYIISTLVFSGIGESVEDLPPVVVEKKRVHLLPRYAR